MSIKIIFVSLISAFFLFSGLACEESDDPIIIGGDIDISVVENKKNGPIVVAITSTDDVDAIENDPENTILYVGGIDEDDLSYKFDLSNTDLKEDDEIFLFAFIDNDYNGGVPSPNLGDFIGFYANTETMTSSYIIENGKNYNLDIKISRVITDFDAKIYYAIDKGKAQYSSGSGKTQEIIMAVHEDGVNISITSGGSMSVDINPDYIMAIDTFNPPEFDHITTDPRPDPAPERVLKILPAIYAGLSISNGTIVGDIYLFSIIDYDANGKLDSSDDVGYYGEDSQIAYVIPGVGTIPIGSFYPKAFSLSTGDNRDGSGSFWINFNYPTVE